MDNKKNKKKITFTVKVTDHANINSYSIKTQNICILSANNA